MRCDGRNSKIQSMDKVLTVHSEKQNSPDRLIHFDFKTSIIRECLTRARRLQFSTLCRKVANSITFLSPFISSTQPPHLVEAISRQISNSLCYLYRYHQEPENPRTREARCLACQQQTSRVVCRNHAAWFPLPLAPHTLSQHSLPALVIVALIVRLPSTDALSSLSPRKPARLLHLPPHHHHHYHNHSNNPHSPLRVPFVKQQNSKFNKSTATPSPSPPPPPLLLLLLVPVLRRHPT